jgi:TIR domain/Effector-associated domain 2
MLLDPTDRAKLVEALLECDCMKTVNSRNTIVQDLPAEIHQRLQLRGTNKEDVNEIVRVCAQFPDGLEKLLQRVRYFEGESYFWRNLEQVVEEVLTKPSVPAPVASPPAAARSNAGSTTSGSGNQITDPIQVFFSYSHKDEDLRDELSTHLAIMKRQHVISEWHDRQLRPGDEWQESIDERINKAQVILLLISANFLASDYCHEIEMKRALERHENREAVVIPIILRPCDWKGALFGKLQALPKDAKPVTTWPNRDEAFTNVAQGIRRAIEGLRAGK